MKLLGKGENGSKIVELTDDEYKIALRISDIKGKAQYLRELADRIDRSITYSNPNEVKEPSSVISGPQLELGDLVMTDLVMAVFCKTIPTPEHEIWKVASKNSDLGLVTVTSILDKDQFLTGSYSHFRYVVRYAKGDRIEAACDIGSIKAGEGGYISTYVQTDEGRFHTTYTVKFDNRRIVSALTDRHLRPNSIPF